MWDCFVVSWECYWVHLFYRWIKVSSVCVFLEAKNCVMDQGVA